MAFKGGIGTLAIVLVISLILGKNPLALLQEIQTQSGSAPSEQTTNYQPSPEEEELSQFVRVVLADTEDVWNKLFSASGESYAEPTLVLFRQSVQSACGMAGSATGPSPPSGEVWGTRGALSCVPSGEVRGGRGVPSCCFSCDAVQRE